MKGVIAIIVSILAFTLGILLGEQIFAKHEYVNCREQLEVCQVMLDDPHHCISVVVEALEGKYDTSIK